MIWICTAVAQEIEQIGADAGPMAGMAARFKLECEKFERAYNLALQLAIVRNGYGMQRWYAVSSRLWLPL